MFKLQGNKKGITLVEVLVAIIIFAVVMLGGFVFFYYGRVHISHSNHQRMALELDKEKIEICRAVGCGDPTENILLGGVQFTRSISLSDEDEEDGYAELTVTTSWQERGNTYSVQLVTIIEQ